MTRKRKAHAVLQDGESGQSSLEYALVTVVFLSVIVGLGALLHAFSDGFGVEKASQSAPYCIEVESGALGYAFVF